MPAQGTVFASMFYGVLFRNKGAGTYPAAASLSAADAAARAYSDMLGTKCPYRAVTLEPSRWAKANFSGSDR